ncbi:MBL fold metallo-hydrolase [Brevibacillus invocatus]|uniref:MBL fold metallo-hydrolase n=1 Tax=Brevibacillus invocatus TaxID=173959 RepID=UPI00203C696E|nr:MBL fold metallo-hydrolase [Brevibacillus invocatus]MCM3081056.1 MBL fold metallo-hydrolase [Brevibacillus invocatus]MCM3431347.1 MBL fold metallo-hydrolase [Brevibacillus invocatus]
MTVLEKRNAAEEMAPGVFRIEVPTPFHVGSVNLYVLIKAEEVTLVDVGPLTEEAWQTLNEGLASIGIGLEQISQIVLTHHHVDHVGQLERVRRASGARTLAHPQAAPYVQMDEDFMVYHDQFFKELYQKSGVPEEKLIIIAKFQKLMKTFSAPSQIDGLLKHEQVLPLFPEWQVLYTPGHSQSHLSLYRAKDRVLIGGDHIIKHISSNAFIEPPRDRSRNRPLTLVQYRTALQMCADMEIDQVFSGHGERVTHHRELILSRLQKNWERTDTLRRLLASGEKTAYELTALLFPTLYEKELPLTISETIGHIDLLMILHQVEVEERDGVLHYHL